MLFQMQKTESKMVGENNSTMKVLPRKSITDNPENIPNPENIFTVEQLSSGMYNMGNNLANRLSLCGPFSNTEKPEMGLFIFILTFLFNVLNSTEVIYIFNTQLIDLNVNLSFMTTCILRLVFYFIVALKLVKHPRYFFYYISLYDPISMPMILSLYAYCMFLFSLFELTIMDYFSMVLMIGLFITFAGFHRVVMTHIFWRKWQLILYKVSLGLAIGVYAIWGVYFIFPGIQWTNGVDPDLDGAVKQFIIFYVIASADFILKLFESVCEVDKTANMEIQENHCNSFVKYRSQTQTNFLD